MLTDCKLSKHHEQILLYFFLGDEDFSLKEWLMLPHSGKNAIEEERIHNYQHSKARQCIENAFVILNSRWRISYEPIRATIENMEKYTLACLALHNYLRLTDKAHYTLFRFVDSEDGYGNLLPSKWRLLKRNDCNNSRLVSLPHVRGCPSRQDAFEARNEWKIFLSNGKESLPWQTEYIRCESHYAAMVHHFSCV